MHWSISLKFSIEFQYVTANALVQGQRVNGRGHSVRNRQRRFTAKSVRFSYLFNVDWWAWHEHVMSNGCQAEVHKTSENTIFSNQKTKIPRKSSSYARTTGGMSFCLWDAFEIARFLVSSMFHNLRRVVLCCYVTHNIELTTCTRPSVFVGRQKYTVGPDSQAKSE